MPMPLTHYPCHFVKCSTITSQVDDTSNSAHGKQSYLKILFENEMESEDFNAKQLAYAE